MNALVTHLRIEDRVLELTGEVAPCYVFDFAVTTLKHGDWAEASRLVREALKREVPAADRGWDPDGKRWYVKVEYRATLAKLFSNFEGALEGLENQPALF